MRVKRGNVSRRRHKRVLEQAEGYRGRSKSSYKIGKLRVNKGLQYAYRDRKVKKRVFRALWITRLSAATRELGLPYRQFISGLRKANIGVNRKVLSELAIREPAVFEAIVDRARAAAK